MIYDSRDDKAPRDIGESTFCLLKIVCTFSASTKYRREFAHVLVEDSSSSGQYLFYWSPMSSLCVSKPMLVDILLSLLAFWV